MEDLERDCAIVLEVASEINRRHSTARELAVNGI
jgi:hypothetical protein